MNVAEPFVRMARQQPDAPALISGAEVTSYKDLLKNVASLAARFQSDGVRGGQRVAVVGSAQLRVASTLALGWIGAVSIDTGGMPDRVLAELADGFGLDALYAPRDADLQGARARVVRIDKLLAESFEGSVPAMHDCPREAWWRITLSSGTTGRPKGIVSTHAALENVHLLRTVYPAGPGDVIVLPMGASMSLAVHNWLRCLYSGACALLAENMPPAELFRLLQGDQPTHCFATPAVANAMAAESAKADAPQPSPGKRLHTFSIGGGRVSVGVRDVLRKRICPNVIVHYGGAEMQIVAVLDPALADARPACSGRLMPWIEVHAVDDAGARLPPGGEGRLRFRSPALASCYVGDSDNSAFQDGWFLSQDRGVVSPDGLVFLRGRANDVINFEGFKFDPEVMEEAILVDRSIVECAVVDVPARIGTQLVAIIVDPSGSADVEALAGRCEKAVPGMRLRHVLRTEKLPRNANGKVMRKAVRKSVEEMLKEGGGPAPRG